MEGDLIDGLIKAIKKVVADSVEAGKLARAREHADTERTWDTLRELHDIVPLAMLRANQYPTRFFVMRLENNEYEGKLTGAHCGLPENPKHLRRAGKIVFDLLYRCGFNPQLQYGFRRPDDVPYSSNDHRLGITIEAG